jgi:cholesterol oxidase
MDGSVMPANPGVNPTLMITALAERAMLFWPNKGDADPRPPLSSGLPANQGRHAAQARRITKGGTELLLDAKKENVIPQYPF